MKRNSIYTAFLAAGLMLGLSACDEREIESYDGANYVHFEQEEAIPYRFSFALTPGSDEYTLELPVKCIGFTPTADLTYSVEVVKTGDGVVTTLDESNYELPEKITFAKGGFEDTLRIKFFNSAELSVEKSLVIRIVDNQNYLAGPSSYCTANIYISDIITRPSWWTDELSDELFGAYSDTKFSHFIIATGVSDLTGVSSEALMSYLREYIYYLRALDEAGNTLYDEDGLTTMLDSIVFKNA